MTFRRQALQKLLLTRPSNPQEILDQLSVCFHFLSYTPTALLVSVSALSHLGRIQFTWPGFLDKVKIAAGKSGTEESKLNARAWLASRISDDVICARSILVHSGQLNALLIRFTFEWVAATQRKAQILTILLETRAKLYGYFTPR